MENKIRCRVLEEANLFLKEKSTVREVAKKMKVSKSTVHKDFKERLPLIDRNIFNNVNNLLEYNKNIRHLRGGEATKQYFLSKKSIS